MSKCLVREQKRFLWWQWIETYTDHDWSYYVSENEKYRKCQNCEITEILWKDYYKDGFRVEDWRVFKKEKK